MGRTRRVEGLLESLSGGTLRTASALPQTLRADLDDSHALSSPVPLYLLVMLLAPGSEERKKKLK